MPTKTKFSPLSGMDNRQEDAALVSRGREPFFFLRDAVNVDLTETGRMNLRGAVKEVTSTPYQNLWGSELHGDLFGTLGNQWVKIDREDWSHTELADLGGPWAFHCTINGRVLVAGADGIFAYDGLRAVPLPLQTPGRPSVGVQAGAFPAGDYGVAVSFLRGRLESSVSEIARVELPAQGGISVGFPYPIDPTVTHVSLFLTKPGSRELHRVGDFPISEPSVTLVAMPELGDSPQFQHLDAMPTGRYLCEWRGRLLTASTKTLWISEALAIHLHDCRHGFVQFPQRITFVQPVDGGIWVGQVDHVVFVEGKDPKDFVVHRRAAKPPVPGSHHLIAADLLGELAAEGTHAALWLASNGYVLGTGAGQLVEIHRKHLQGIRASHGITTVWGERILTLLG